MNPSIFLIPYFIFQISTHKAADVIKDFFNRNYRDFNFTITSGSSKIHINPLPPNAPDNFAGAVGNYKVKTTIDKNKAKTGDAITLRIKISGKGNLKLIEALPLDLPPDIDVFDPKIIDNINVSTSGMSGNITFEYYLIPRTPGKYKIKPVNFTYFDLNEKIHNTLGFGYGYLNMGIIHFRKKSFSEAINCYKKALSIFKELKSNSMIVNTYRFLSLVYLKTGDLESTEETLSKIEKYVETSESTLLKASKDWIRGKLFMTNGEYAKAEVLLLNAYGLYTRMEDIDGLLNTSYDLICLYRAIEDTGKVKHFISKAKKIIDNITKEIREQELIKSFLNREVVKKILFNTE